MTIYELEKQWKASSHNSVDGYRYKRALSKHMHNHFMEALEALKLAADFDDASRMREGCSITTNRPLRRLITKLETVVGTP